MLMLKKKQMVLKMEVGLNDIRNNILLWFYWRLMRRRLDNKQDNNCIRKEK